MSTLLILTKAPNRSNRSFIDRVLTPQDGIACVMDGVYLTNTGNRPDVPVYALGDDLDARGMHADADKRLDYGGLIDLAFAYDRVVTV